MKRDWWKRAKPLIFVLAIALVLCASNSVKAQEEGQMITIDIIPVGIEGEIQGAISLQLPPGYELWKAIPEEISWGEQTVTCMDYEYHGTRVLETITAPDGSQYSTLGEQADGIGLGGGVLFERGLVDIKAEAEQYLRPYIEGTVYEEGTLTVPGDGVNYPGYYYLSTHVEEHTSIISRAGEKIEYRWTSVHHNLHVRIALSQSRPLYTVYFWAHTWGLPDHTDEHGRRHTYTIDGEAQLARHRSFIKQMLSSVRISGWKAPSPAPAGVTGSHWLDAIPLPTQVSLEPEVVGTNLGLALLFALAFALTSTLFNQTLEENEELIYARLAPLLAPFRRVLKRLPRPSEGPQLRIAKHVLLLLLSALLYAFLDPEFGLSASGMLLLFSLFIALAVLVYSYDGTQALLGAKLYNLRARFQLFPIALAFGIACVLLTRQMDFHPGYLYGFVAGFTFLGIEPETPRRWAFLVLVGVGALMAVSLAAWGLAVPVSRLAEGGLPGASVLYGVLVAIFVAGLEGLLFTLVPLTFLDGSKVMAWNRAVWMVAFGLAAWLFFHVLINPDSAYLEALASKKVLLMLGTLALYSALTVGLWLFFRWYARRKAPRPTFVEAAPPPTREAAIEPPGPPPAATPRPEEAPKPSGLEEREPGQAAVERPAEITCANCKGTFRWDEAYCLQDTPGAHAYNPPGYGDFRPRAFCPHCGFLIAEWDIDRYGDRNRWKWHKANAEVNRGKPLPPSPLTHWGKMVPYPARPITEEEFLDIPRVKALLEEMEREREWRKAQKAREIAPDDLEGHCKRGFLHLEDEELDEAIADFKRCLRLRDDYAPAHRGLGWAYYLLTRRPGRPEGTMEMALFHLLKAIRLDPRDGETHFLLGIIHHNEDRDEEAIAEWKKALELGLPKEKEALVRSHLGQKYVDQGRLAEAVAEFERAEALDPSLLAPHAYLRIIYDAWGEREKAEAERRQEERTCRGRSLIPSVRARVRELALRTRLPPVTPPTRREAPKARVICPKCGARNSPARKVCDQCGADLLPGRSIGERARRFALFLLFIFLAVLCSYVEELRCLTWLFLALAAFQGGGLLFVFGRTPEYEKYVRRAQRHIEAEPEQALADFARALELAPENERAKILQQRARVCEKLGLEPGEIGKPVVVEKPQRPPPSVKAVEARRRPRRGFAWATNLIAAFFLLLFILGIKLTAMDYAKGVPNLTGGAIVSGTFLLTALLMALLSVVLAKRKTRALLIWGVAMTATLIVAVIIAMPMLKAKLLTAVGVTPPTETPAPTFTAFQGDVFSFDYPSDWEVITEKEVGVLLRTSLKGLKPGDYDYIGGVYTGGLDNCRGCAIIVVVVVKNPSLTGTLTDEQYERAKAVAERQLGSRLISHRRVEVSSMPAIEWVHLGKSGLTKLWELIVVPPEPGIAYLFSCSSHKDSYDDFEGVFERAIRSLRIEEQGPTPTPVRPTPTPGVITYTVQAGDTLSEIAVRFGVTVEAIVEANDIEDPSKIWVGQVLVIPLPKLEEQP